MLATTYSNPSSGPIVGRRDELAQLDAALDALEGGTAACLAVEGEPGIGKTRLLGELARRAQARGLIVLWGSAAEFERDLPYGVWVDALDAYVAAQELGEDPADDHDLLSGLAGVLPSLGGGSPAADGDQRHRTHRSMLRLLAVLAEREPMVLLLDDLHWSDGASIELIRSFLRRGSSSRVLLALGYRTGSMPAALGAALAAASVAPLELGVLSADECRELAGSELTPARQGAIFEESGGNPFYALQLARAARMPASSRTGDRMAQGAGVPRTVAAALLMELEGLGGNARLLLDAGSIAGDPFEPELASEIAGLTPAAGIDALDELLDARLLHATSVPRRFGFRHPLVRRAVYESTRGGWRLAAHERAAAILASRGASAPQLAHHVEHSASTGDEVAIGRLLEAGRETAPRAPAAAAHWFGAALRLVPAEDRATRLQALVSLARARGAVGDLERCASTLAEALALVPAGADSQRVTLTAALAAAEHFLGHHGRATERLTDALEALPDQGTREGVTVLMALAAGGILGYDRDLGRTYSRRALVAARRLEDPVLIGSAASALAHASANVGDVATLRAAADEATHHLDPISDEALAGCLDAINRLAWAEFLVERYDDSIRHATRAGAVARRTGQYQYVPMITGARVLSLLRRGDLAQASALQEEGLEIAELAANDYVTSWVLTVSAHAAMVCGRLEEARTAGERAVALASGHDGSRIAAIALVRLTATRCELGDRDCSTSDLVAAAGGWEFPLIPPTWAVYYCEAMTRVSAQHEQHADAEAFASKAEEKAEHLGLPLACAIARRARAAVLLLSGSAREAAAEAGRSADEASTAGAPIEAARSSLMVGRALAEAGERRRAVESLRGSEAVFHSSGALRDRAEARRELRRLGARSGPHGPRGVAGDGVGSLSGREREVADLVTARFTNREVAAELFLSEKTVESHLRNIFAKLGVSSRVDVARAVEAAADSP